MASKSNKGRTTATATAVPPAGDRTLSIKLPEDVIRESKAAAARRGDLFRVFVANALRAAYGGKA
jgi:hypothetical protein